MAYIKKLTDTDGNSYDLKDEEARESIQDRVMGKSFSVSASSTLKLNFQSNTSAIIFSSGGSSSSMGLIAFVEVSSSKVLTVSVVNSTTNITVAKDSSVSGRLNIQNSASTVGRLLVLLIRGSFPTTGT